jgi:hypothetical protein
MQALGFVSPICCLVSLHVSIVSSSCFFWFSPNCRRMALKRANMVAAVAAPSVCQCCGKVLTIGATQVLNREGSPGSVHTTLLKQGNRLSEQGLYWSDHTQSGYSVSCLGKRASLRQARWRPQPEALVALAIAAHLPGGCRLMQHRLVDSCRDSSHPLPALPDASRSQQRLRSSSSLQRCVQLWSTVCS